MRCLIACYDLNGFARFLCERNEMNLAIQVFANLLGCEQDNFGFSEVEAVVVGEPCVLKVYERHIGSPAINTSAIWRAGQCQAVTQAKQRNSYG